MYMTVLIDGALGLHSHYMYMYINGLWAIKFRKNMAVLKTREYMYAYGYMHSIFLLELRSKSMYEIFVKDSKTKMIRTAPIIYQVSYKSSYQSLNASNVKLFLQCICQLF